MADDSLAVWGRMTYQERLYVLGQNYPDGIPADALETLLKDEIKRQFGYMSVYLDHPEIGPLLRRAGSEGWTLERLQAELSKTEWWKTTTATQREWDLLLRTDPASAEKKIADLTVQLKTLASQQGFADRYTDEQFKQFAAFFLYNGVPQQDMARAMFQNLDYDPTKGVGGQPGGAAGLTMQQVKKRAADFGLPMSDEAAYEWARQVAAGLATPESIDVFLRNQAKSRYSWLAPDLDRGATVKQLFDPYLQQTAQLLERSPDMFSLEDPLIQKMIDHVGSDGTRRSMTLSEAAEAVRNTPEWLKTMNARQGSASLGEEIIKTFGKVA